MRLTWCPAAVNERRADEHPAVGEVRRNSSQAALQRHRRTHKPRKFFGALVLDELRHEHDLAGALLPAELAGQGDGLNGVAHGVVAHGVQLHAGAAAGIGQHETGELAEIGDLGLDPQPLHLQAAAGCAGNGGAAAAGRGAAAGGGCGSPAAAGAAAQRPQRHVQGPVPRGSSNDKPGPERQQRCHGH